MLAKRWCNFRIKELKNCIVESESTPYGSKEPETCLSERGIKTFREFTTGLFFFFFFVLSLLTSQWAEVLTAGNLKKKTWKQGGGAGER